MNIPCGGGDKQAATAVNPELPPPIGGAGRRKQIQPTLEGSEQQGGYKNEMWIRSQATHPFK